MSTLPQVVVITMSFITLSDLLAMVSILVSIVVAFFIYRLQKSTDDERLAAQENIEKTNHMITLFMNAEISLYQTIMQIVADCYLSASGLHPTHGVGSGPADYQERQKWHESRCNDLLEKVRRIEVLKEANRLTLPEDIFDSLKKFTDLCFEQVGDYTSAYMPEPLQGNTDEWGTRGPTQEKCYQRNEVIKKAYMEVHQKMHTRIDEIKQGAAK